MNLRIRVTRVGNTANPVWLWGAINPGSKVSEAVEVVRNHGDGTCERFVPHTRDQGVESSVERRGRFSDVRSRTIHAGESQDRRM